MIHTCKSCKHYKSLEYIPHSCHRWVSVEKKISLITGRKETITIGTIRSCISERSRDGECGSEGLFWEPK